MTDSYPRVRISARGADWLRSGHPWVFRSEIVEDSGAESGELVQVSVRRRSGGGVFLGQAFYSSKSLIALRLITTQDQPCDRDFWRGRLQRAIELRRALGGEDTAGRLVFAESDDIPGLIVDRYADVLVLQTLCAGVDRLKETWLELLRELLEPAAVVERNDTGSRKLEDLPVRAGVLRGELRRPLEVRLGGLLRLVDPLEGQKTGAYLDQRENYLRAARLTRGRCLDAFCYQGGFGLALKQAGAEEVVLLDQSEKALQLAAADAERNGLRVETRQANVFDQLHAWKKAGESFDLVVLDPPAFAKNRESVPAARRGYKEINLRAMQLLKSGGVLVTCSCSHHMQEQQFEAVLLDAAVDSRCRLQIIERRGAAADHPVRLGFPESGYLKCFILRVLR